MPLMIIQGDLTKVSCDAIVNAANNSLLGGGGVDGAIHRAAGKRLLEECKTLGGCETGDAKITAGYDLPAKYVIHTVGPVWQGGGRGEKEQLISCYRRSLALAKENGCESVAFPLISAGAYGYPKAEAFSIAEQTIGAFLQENEMRVYLVIFDGAAFLREGKPYREIRDFIKKTYAEEPPKKEKPHAIRPLQKKAAVCEETACFGAAPLQREALSLDQALEQMDESFSEMLLRKIDEKGMTDAACYKKANIDRKLFSKIRSDRLYRPSKATALAFAIALELPLDETADLLRKAGFALSHSSKFDIIIEYYIMHGKYDIFEINETLFAFDQCLLGN